MRGLAGVALALATAATLTASASAARSPKALRAAMLRAVDARHSVHYASRNTSPGRAVLLTCDVGRGVGVQRITFGSGSSEGTGLVRIVHRMAYIRGDALTLHDYFGFTEAQATRYAGKWISIPPSSKSYAPVAADATFESFAAGLLPKRRLSVVTATIGRTRAVGLQGTVKEAGIPFVETVYAPAHGRPLALRKRAVAPSSGGASLITLSRWDEAVHVRAPKHAVPIKQVRGGGPVA